jgi:flagellar protein FlgJ
VLNQRSNASTLLAPVGTVHNGQVVSVRCQLGGETISGRTGRTSNWDRLSNGHFVSDAYIAWPGRTRPTVPWCSLGTGPAPAAGSAFIAWAARYARSTMRAYQVPASVTIAQAILESGWGGSGLTRDGNNYFGMKCFGTPGRIALGCRTYRTTECGTRCFPTRASFRMYLSPWYSFKDHGYALRTLSRYANAFRYTKDANRFAIEIHKAGYATSPTYAQKLIALMKKYNLYRYDR